MTDREINFVTYMIDTYGVASCFNNIDEDNTLEEEGLWFECPICGEPILFEDWDLDEMEHECPVCGERYDEE